jgi:hypothetical protein
LGQSRTIDEHWQDAALRLQGYFHLRSDVIDRLVMPLPQQLGPARTDDDQHHRRLANLAAQTLGKLLRRRNIFMIVEDFPTGQPSLEPFVKKLDGIRTIGAPVGKENRGHGQAPRGRTLDGAIVTVVRQFSTPGPRRCDWPAECTTADGPFLR